MRFIRVRLRFYLPSVFIRVHLWFQPLLPRRLAISRVRYHMAMSVDESTSKEDQTLLARQRQVAAAVGVTAACRRIFLCCDQTKPKCCDRERSLEAWEYLKRRLKELG